MNLILIIILIGIIFLAGCIAQQSENITKNVLDYCNKNTVVNNCDNDIYKVSYLNCLDCTALFLNSTGDIIAECGGSPKPIEKETKECLQMINLSCDYTRNLCEIPEEIAVEENITKNLCEQKIIFDDVIISFNGDCIVMNISDSVTKQPIPNATVKLTTGIVACPLALHIHCQPEIKIILEKQMNEKGFVFIYKEEILSKTSSSAISINISADGYNSTSRKFDYEYNQLINFELEPIKTYCKQDSDCIKVFDSCCGCERSGTAIAVNKNYKSYWDDKVAEDCKVKSCLATAVVPTNIECFVQPRCIDNTCMLDYKDYTVCEKLKSHERDWCYYRFAIKNNDVNICENVEFNEENVTPSKPTCKRSLS